MREREEISVEIFGIFFALKDSFSELIHSLSELREKYDLSII